MKWIVVVDIAPRTIVGTNGCHKYVFNSYKTKREACEIRDRINLIADMGKAYVEKEGS